MEEAFVVMQIGNKQLDSLWKEVYIPVIKECGLVPKRVDKHNEGRLLQSEIADFVKRAKIVIADLTNERPNCYLEVGYAMGIDKFKNLILCAREDHHHESSNYTKGGPKIHFDLSGYGFLWWEETKLDDFRKELTFKIKQRLELLKKNRNTTVEESAIEIWQEKERDYALVAAEDLNLSSFYEISFELTQNLPNRNQPELLKIAEAAQVHNSGWPIGVVLNNDKRPKPVLDGIKTIILSDTFDYWYLKKDGRFYFLRNFEEDLDIKGNKPGKNIHLDTRIRRITEAIMYCFRLYKGFDGDGETPVRISITHKGLRNRIIAVADTGRFIPSRWNCTVDEVKSSEILKVAVLMPDIKDIVFKFATELFIMFDYFDLTRAVCDDIIDKFISRKY